MYNHSQERIRNLEANVVAILEHISQVHAQLKSLDYDDTCAYLVLNHNDFWYPCKCILEHGPI